MLCQTSILKTQMTSFLETFREWEEVEDIPWMYSIPLEMEEEQSTEYQIIAETKMMN